MQKTFSREGTQWFLPTIATNTTEVFLASAKAVRDYWEMGGTGVLGLHLEGPWINLDKRGAHIAEWIHQPNIDEVKTLVEQTAGVLKMVTLAPEICSPQIISLFKSAGIVVSAGHSGASYAQALEGFENGITTVTHLYNAMSGLHHREPGLVGAAMDHSSVKASIIPDGHHVDFAAVRIAKQAMGDRLFAITDAVTDTLTGPYRHKKIGDRYECEGTLSGSALSMHSALMNLVHKAQVDLAEAIRMCSLYPARVIRSKAVTGNIQPGHPAAFIALDDDLQFLSLLTSP
jgi:N-acetylglucosamine-6-phosphate deacetylase